MTDLTNAQKQRLESLNSAVDLLTDIETSEGGSSILSKSGSKNSRQGLIGATAETRDMHITSAVLAAIDLAEYVVSGPEREQPRIVIDEDGTRIEDGR